MIVFSNIVHSLSPFLVCVPQPSQINLCFQNINSTHVFSLVLTRRFAAKPRKRESILHAKKVKSHWGEDEFVFLGVKELKRSAFKNRCELSLGDVKRSHRRDMCPRVQQQLQTESNSALLHAYSWRCCCCCCCSLLGIDDASPLLQLWLDSFIYQHLCCTFYAGRAFKKDFCSITSAPVTRIYLLDPPLHTDTRQLEFLGTLWGIKPSTWWFSNYSFCH